MSRLIKSTDDIETIATQIDNICNTGNRVCRSFKPVIVTKPRSCTSDIQTCCANGQCTITNAPIDATELENIRLNIEKFSTEQNNEGVTFVGVNDVDVCKLGDAYHGYTDVSDIDGWITAQTQGETLVCGKANINSMYSSNGLISEFASDKVTSFVGNPNLDYSHVQEEALQLIYSESASTYS